MERTHTEGDEVVISFASHSHSRSHSDSDSETKRESRRPTTPDAIRLTELDDAFSAQASLSTGKGYALLRERLILRIRGYGLESSQAEQAGHDLVRFANVRAARHLSAWRDGSQKEGGGSDGEGEEGEEDALPSRDEVRAHGSAAVAVPSHAGKSLQIASVLLAAAEAALLQFPHPELESAWLTNTALLQRAAGRPRTALSLLHSALEMQAKRSSRGQEGEVESAQVLLNISSCQSKLGNHEAALDAALEAKELLGDHIRTFFTRFTQIARGEVEEDALLQDPSDLDVLQTILGLFHNAGVEHEHLAEYKDASKAYSIAAEVASRLPGDASMAIHHRLLDLSQRTKEAHEVLVARVQKKRRARGAGLPREAKRTRPKRGGGGKKAPDRLLAAYGATSRTRAAASARMGTRRSKPESSSSGRMGPRPVTPFSKAGDPAMSLPPLTPGALGLTEEEFERLMGARDKALESIPMPEYPEPGQLTAGYATRPLKPWLNPADPTRPSRTSEQLQRDIKRKTRQAKLQSKRPPVHGGGRRGKGGRDGGDRGRGDRDGGDRDWGDRDRVEDEDVGEDGGDGSGESSFDDDALDAEFARLGLREDDASDGGADDASDGGADGGSGADDIGGVARDEGERLNSDFDFSLSSSVSSSKPSNSRYDGGADQDETFDLSGSRSPDSSFDQEMASFMSTNAQQETFNSDDFDLSSDDFDLS